MHSSRLEPRASTSTAIAAESTRLLSAGILIMSGLATVSCAGPRPDESGKLVAVTHLEFPSVEAGATSLSRVYLGPGGHWLVSPLEDQGLIAVFSADGKFDRIVGHQGQGPGEFGGIQSLQTLPSGQVMIFHPPRVSLLDSNFKQVVGEQLTLAVTNPVLIGSSTILSTRMLMPGQPGDPFTVSTTSLDSLWSMPDPFEDLAGDVVLRHVVALDADRALISPVSSYELAILDLGGRRTQVIPIAERRFPGGRLIDAARGDPRLVRPSGRITAIGALTDSTVFIAYAVAKPTWEVMSGAGQEERAMPSINEMSGLLDFYLEVLEVPSGRSVWHGRLPAAINGSIGLGRGFSYTESEAGEIGIDIVEIRRLIVQHTSGGRK